MLRIDGSARSDLLRDAVAHAREDIGQTQAIVSILVQRLVQSGEVDGGETGASAHVRIFLVEGRGPRKAEFLLLYRLLSSLVLSVYVIGAMHESLYETSWRENAVTALHLEELPTLLGNLCELHLQGCLAPQLSHLVLVLARAARAWRPPPPSDFVCQYAAMAAVAMASLAGEVDSEDGGEDGDVVGADVASEPSELEEGFGSSAFARMS